MTCRTEFHRLDVAEDRTGKVVTTGFALLRRAIGDATNCEDLTYQDQSGDRVADMLDALTPCPDCLRLLLIGMTTIVPAALEPGSVAAVAERIDAMLRHAAAYGSP